MKNAVLNTVKGLFLLAVLTTLLLGLIGIGGCTAVQSPTQNDLRVVGVDGEQTSLLSNSGQNTQLWPDGSQQTGSTQLDSGVVTEDSMNWQSTALSTLFNAGKLGVQIKNPGNLGAEKIKITFGDLAQDPDTGRLFVQIKEIEIDGLTNEVTSVIEASTEQVALWVDALGEIAPVQAEAIIAAMERDKAITAETARLIRAGLESLTPVP